LEVDKVDRVALALYTLETKLNVSATKLNVYGDSRLCCRFVAGVYRALDSRCVSAPVTVTPANLYKFYVHFVN